MQQKACHSEEGVSPTWESVQKSFECKVAAGKTDFEKCGWPRPFRARNDIAYTNAFYIRMAVPVFPAMPSLAFSSRVMRAVLPLPDSANFTAASTLGSMEPGAN